MINDAIRAIRKNRLRKTVSVVFAGILTVVIGQKVLEALDRNQLLESVKSDSGWIVGINNPSSLNRPIRRARLVLLAQADPAAGAAMDRLDINFQPRHLVDNATYERLIAGTQLGGMTEEVLNVTVRHPGLKHRAYRGRLTIWYGNPRDKEKLILEPVFVPVMW